MIEYCKGTPADIDDIIDFANYIFSQNEAPHDFKQLLPKVYSDKYNTAEHHYLVKDNGKIKAMLLALPSDIKVGDTLLKTCGIGTVAVHPYARGCGYMKELMNTAIADMKKDGYHFSVLGGQRQRYEYFGYEPCGMQVTFTITSTNVKHAYKELDCSNISIELLTSKDETLIEEAYNLHKTQKLAGVRNPVEFFDVVSSWKSKIYAIKCDGDFCGYVVRSGNSIMELVLSDMNRLPFVIKVLITKEKLDEIQVNVSLFEQEKLAYLSNICEAYKLTINHSINIFDYKTVIKAFMELKASYADMPDGEVAMKIGDETILICAHSKKITIEDYTGKPDVEFSNLDAMLHLFSPAGDFLNSTIKLPEPAKAWFPLPLFIPPLDCC